MYKIIDGNAISKEILEELKNKINVLNVTGKNRVLYDIVVGDDPASEIYINNKIKKFHDMSIKFELVKLPAEITEKELLDKIEELNNNKNANAIFVELPLPKQINELNIIDKINPKKDVDGFSKMSLGALFQNSTGFYPCTAEGIAELIDRSNISVEGKNLVVVGRSNIVGKPVALLMLNRNATVTICHSKTNDLREICKNADILIVAIGKPNFIDDTFIKEGAVVIDAGINRIEVDGIKKVCGDVDFDKVASHTSYITPVPGGVGPMTVTMLIKHCVETIDYE